jgi:hypothetical protein
MAFALTAGKSSGYDYAVVRFDLQANVERIWVEQADLECAVVDRTLATRLDEACLIRGFLPVGRGSPVLRRTEQRDEVA